MTPDFDPLLDDLGHAMGDGDDRVQAVRVRDDDAAVHRLRDRARRTGRARRTTSPRSCARSPRAPSIACGSRSPSKHRPPTPYAAKFSTPFCMAVGFLDRRAGFAQFTESRIDDPAVLALAAKIRYSVNPHDEYPRNFTGHLRATLKDGSAARDSPAVHARRRACPAAAGGTGNEVHGQRGVWRLAARRRRAIQAGVSRNSFPRRISRH